MLMQSDFQAAWFYQFRRLRKTHEPRLAWPGTIQMTETEKARGEAGLQGEKSSSAHARMAAEAFPQPQSRRAGGWKSRKNATNAVCCKWLLRYGLRGPQPAS